MLTPHSPSWLHQDAPQLTAGQNACLGIRSSDSFIRSARSIWSKYEIVIKAVMRLRLWSRSDLEKEELRAACEEMPSLLAVSLVANYLISDTSTGEMPLALIAAGAALKVREDCLWPT